MTRPTQRPAVALVTGASSGIGAQAALALQERGLVVVGAARRTRPIEELGVPAVRLDLTEEASVEAAVSVVQERFGAVDVLVNNAGYGEFGALEDIPLERARSQLEVNVLGAVDLIQRVLPGMRASGHGRIVNVSSLAGRFASPLGGWYHASKFALEALSDSLRMEVQGFGIHVALVEPGYVRTDWHTIAAEQLVLNGSRGAYQAMSESVADHLRQAGDTRQACDPTEVATAIVRASLDARPRARYLVGRGSRMAVTAAATFPTRTFDRMTRSTLGIR